MTKKARHPAKHPKTNPEQDEQSVKSTAAAGKTAAAASAASAASATVAGDSETVEKLEKQLEEARQKADENWDLVLRARAELDNLRKRAQRDVENAHKYGVEKIANELLAVRDSMELGLHAAQADSTDVESLREGAELTLKMLTQVMERFDIQEINPLHEKFNPDLHQAMTMQESTEQAPNTVIFVMQKGYILSDRLLRPALVTVARAPETSA